MNPRPPYHAYLLRLWPANAAGADMRDWRASLEDPHTGEIYKFNSLKRLFEFLEDQCSLDETLKSTPS